MDKKRRKSTRHWRWGMSFSEGIEKEIMDAVSGYEDGLPLEDGFDEYTIEDAMVYMVKELWGKDWIQHWRRKK